MSNSAFNLRWAEVIIEALARHGMKNICIAPGSRSTPLTLAAVNNTKLHCHTHFDERGLGHLALGLAKASGEPVGVIVTSGTAVANLYPSLIEAGLTGEKVIFLTADRPPELIDCGANQAIRQTHIFASHPFESLMLPRPTRDISAKWLVSALDNGMNQLRHGAFHVNCPFAEPLYGETEGETEWQASLGDWWQSSHPWLSEPPTHTVALVADWYFWRQKKGVVIAGRMSSSDGELVAKWAEELGWPVIGDVLSQTGQPYPCADLWLQHPNAKAWLDEAELVVQFGSSLTGKRALQWQSQCHPQEYWIIDTIPGRLDPANHQGRKLTCSVKGWIEQHPAQPRGAWSEGLTDLTSRTLQHVQAQLQGQFSEAAVAHQLPELLPPRGQLFVGNSLIVRLIDALAQLPAGYPVFSNRGASGIDGLISTMAGVQRATAKPTLGIVGDISALYDLNSLALLREPSAPSVLIIVNNNGGQIFSMLPTSPEARQNYYCMPQNVSFAGAAMMFGLQYCSPTDWSSLKETVQEFWHNQNKQHNQSNQHGTLLIELVVDGDEGARTLKTIAARRGKFTVLAAHYYPSQEQPANGEKTPWLVFLHGLLGSHDDWSSIVEACPNYPRLVVDLPGHGDSHRIGCQGFVDFDKQLTQLLAHYSASQYVLIGYSLGARLAMHFACFSTHQGLQGLVIEGGNVGLQSEQERIARADNDHRWAERFRHQPIEQVLSDWYQQAVFADLTLDQREKLVALRCQNNPLAVADMLENTSLSKQPFLVESLKQLSVPYCYFCGEKDQKFRGVSQQYALPFTLIENAGHNAHRENPQHYVIALHHFLSHCG